MDLWMIKRVRGLEPSDEASTEALRRIKLGKLVKVEISSPRNINHHRKFFALLNLVWSAAGDWPSVDDLLVELKFRLGLVQEFVLRTTGEVVRIPGSISFGKMSQEEFDVFYERALRELCVMCGGIEYDALREEVMNQLAAA